MQFKKVDGLTGAMKSIEFSPGLQKFIIFNDTNNAFTIAQNSLTHQSLEKLSYFNDKDGKKISFYLISHHKQNDQFSAYGYTQNFQKVTITGQFVLSNLVQLNFIYGDTETLFKGEFSLPNWELIVKSPDFEIILNKVSAEKVDDNNIAADAIMFDESDQQFYAFQGQNLQKIPVVQNPPIKMELPNNFLKCDNTINAMNHNFLLEVTEQDGSRQLYFCSFDKVSKEFQLKKQNKTPNQIKRLNENHNKVKKLALKKHLGENQFVKIFLSKQGMQKEIFAIDKQAQLHRFNRLNFQFEKDNTSTLPFNVVQVKDHEKISTLVIQTDDPENPLVIFGQNSPLIKENYAKYGLNSTYLDQQIVVHLIDPKLHSLSKIEYAVIQTEEELVVNNEQVEQSENIKQCVEQLNSLLKKIKFTKLKRLLFKKQQKLSEILTFDKLELGQPELIKQIIDANQFLFDVKEYVLARSLDQNYYPLTKYKIFAEKFGLPYFLYFLQYLVQKTCRKLNQNNQEQFKFDRLNSDISLFEQLYKQAAGKSIKLFTQSFERPFKALFIGEGSIDAGGPFREIIENISTEITDIYFKPTSNMQILDESSGYQPTNFTSVQDLKRFQFIGKMIGWSLNSTVYNLSLDLNVIFWKRLCQIPILIEDIKSVDKQRYETVQRILSGEQQSNFEADLGDGDITELCEGGSEIPVTEQNKEKFAELYLKKYLEQDELVSQTIIKGIRQIANPLVLGYITPTSGPVTAFSTPKLHAEVLNSQITIDDYSREGTRVLANFQQMVREFTNEERQALVKFITGSSRLGPSKVIRLNLQSRYGSSQKNDQNFPVAHTCGESCDIWNYSTLEIMKEKFRFAISSCGEIDGDGDANVNNDPVLNNNNSSNNIIQDDFLDSEQEQLFDINSQDDYDELKINSQNPLIVNQILTNQSQIFIDRDTIYNDCHSNADNQEND